MRYRVPSAAPVRITSPRREVHKSAELLQFGKTFGRDLWRESATGVQAWR